MNYPSPTFSLALLCLSLFACKPVAKANPNHLGHQQAAEVIQEKLADQGYSPQDGDIIFQETAGAQSDAIQITTDSRYTHVGIIFELEDGSFGVLEGAQPVRVTRLEDFISSGVDGHFVIKRLNADQKQLSEEQIATMKKEGREMLGKPYDLLFAWSDDQIYCSELVWKLYQRGAGLEVGEIQKLGDFDLTDPQVAPIVLERYGQNPPLEQELISPAAMFDSELLETVAEG